MLALGTVSGIARAVGGRLVRGGLGRRPVHGVGIDTRRMAVGGVFFALEGSKQDGHRYVRQAARNGAAAVVVSRLESIQPLPDGLAVILVQDVVGALSSVAAWYRAQLGAQVVAITGTAGKSTTKQLLAAILAAAGPTSASPGSFNNHLGVPLSILMAGRDARYLVLEMGTSNPGEISALSRLARPDLAMITNIGPGHLDGLGDLDGVARAKREILDGLAADGQIVLSADDAHSRELTVTLRESGRCVYTFGKSGDLRVVDQVRVGQGMQLKTNDGARWYLGACRGPELQSALGAIIAARALGVDDATIARGLARYEPLPMRMERFELAGGVTLINDTYNANPLSVGAAVDYLAELAGGRRTVAVLGEMLELGAQRQAWHESVGRRTGQRIDLVWGVGPSASYTARGASDTAWTCLSMDTEDVTSRIAGAVKDGDVVLIKGSRRMQMERVSAALISARKLETLDTERSDEAGALPSPHTATS